MENPTEIKTQAIKNYFKAIGELKNLDILTNKKDFTGQIGEWLVETIYDGKRAEKANQKGWDIDVNGKHIQVKTHAKAFNNNNRWSAVEPTEDIDELIIIIFSEVYKLKEFYIIPWTIAKSKIKKRGQKKSKPEINWSDFKEYQVDINKLPKQDIISIFR